MNTFYRTAQMKYFVREQHWNINQNYCTVTAFIYRKKLIRKYINKTKEKDAVYNKCV